MKGIQTAVIELAAAAHKAHWNAGQDVSEQTKAAQACCKEWQKQAMKAFPDRFIAEYPVGDCRETFDLVDCMEGTIYELKTSGKNAHLELYKDVLKCMVHNEQSARPIKKLVFITEPAGAARLHSRFADAVGKLAAKSELIVEVCGV
jgi:hypothetical protein